MRHARMLALAVLVLAFAGTAAAATITVSITKNGYVPSTSTVAIGDSVQFTNGDTVAHQVTFKSTSGVVCTPNPLVLQPGQSGSCTFSTAGKYSYSDPNVKGKTFSGTVTVAAATPAPAGSIKLTAAPLLVTYGGKSTLSGTLASQQTGQSVQVLGQPCGGNAAPVSTATTTTAGAFSSVVQPLQNTAYSAKLKNATSNAVTVKVSPRVSLAKVAAHRYSVRVTAAASFAGKYVAIQRYNGALGRWQTFKSVRLVAAGGGVAPTVISGATFRAAIASGLRLHAVLGLAQTGSCYWAGRSGIVRS
jgi:plastocyanin